MEPYWNRYLKKLALGEPGYFAYVCLVCNITQTDDYPLNCVNDNNGCDARICMACNGESRAMEKHIALCKQSSEYK
eukprot:10036040-Karenia_brevis.AAC.1